MDTSLTNSTIENGNAGDPGTSRFPLRRLAPLVVLVAGLGIVLALDLDRFLTFDALKENRDLLTSWVARNGLLAAVAFIAVYAAAIAVSVPGAAILTMTSGFLFGAVVGTLCAVTGATIGAVIVFAAARTAVGDLLKAKAGPRLKKMEAGFRENAFSYLLTLRLIPIFPFWLINLAPAFLGVPILIFFAATFIGIIPGGFVYALVGAGLGSIFDRGESFSVSSVLTPELMVAFAGLGLFSLLPVAYKKFKSLVRDNEKTDP